MLLSHRHTGNPKTASYPAQRQGLNDLRGPFARLRALPSGAGRPLHGSARGTYLESFISICCRISCLSSSVLLGKMFRSSSSCLLGRFLSFTASSSFLHFLGKVPVRPTGMKKYLSGPASYGLHGLLSGAWTGGQELKVGVLHMLHCAAFQVHDATRWAIRPL